MAAVLGLQWATLSSLRRAQVAMIEAFRAEGAIPHAAGVALPGHAQRDAREYIVIDLLGARHLLETLRNSADPELQEALCKTLIAAAEAHEDGMGEGDWLRHAWSAVRLEAEALLGGTSIRDD